MDKIQVGIGSYAFAWAIGVPNYTPANPMDVWSFLDVAYRLNAEVVQLADNLPVQHFSVAQMTRLRDWARDHQISLELGVRGLRSETLSQHLRTAHFLDCSILRVVIDEPGYEPTPDQVVRMLKEQLPALKSLNIRLALENHDRFFARIFRNLVEDTDPEWIGICLDSVNSLGKGEGFIEVVRQLLPYVFNVHVKDYQVKRVDHQMGFQVTGTPAGKGLLPISWLWRRLKEEGRCQSMILELWPPPEGQIEATIRKEYQWAVQSMEYLQVLNQKMKDR